MKKNKRITQVLSRRPVRIRDKEEGHWSEKSLQQQKLKKKGGGKASL